MSSLNAFAEKALLHNKFVTPEQVAKAKAYVVKNADVDLIDALTRMGALSPKRRQAVIDLYEKRQSARVSSPAAKNAAASGASGLPKADVASFTRLEDYLKYARDAGGSDLQILTAAPPLVRINGTLTPMDRKPIEPEEAEKLLMSALSEEQQKVVREEKSLDFCLSLDELGRYRSCIYKQRLGWDGAFRIIQARVPTLEELGLPPSVQRLTEFHQGMVLITGPIGCGKSTTMAAMVELVNQQRSDHIITLEDPIEFIFESKKCQITQREVGANTRSFSAALRAALREDPDVIMIGELRDLETVSLAISAAETGHLVFGSLHTTSAARTIDRILNVFPPDQQPQVRAMISESIKGVVCQQLVKRKDGNGRVLAAELLFNTPAAGNLIRECRLHQLTSVMQMGKKEGMIMLDNSLLELVEQGVIDGEEAYFCADDKSKFITYKPVIG